jgi:hypothetical protein
VGPGSAEQREERCAASGTRDHFAVGGVSRIRPAGLAVSGPGASSPRVPVAIRNDAAGRIATAGAAATITKGVFIVADRDADHRASSRKIANVLDANGLEK